MTVSRVAPEPFAEAIDLASDEDRRWFEKHPSAGQRTRRLRPGEMWPWSYPEEARVLVTQIERGWRVRRPLLPPNGAYDEQEAAVMAEHMPDMPENWQGR